MLTFCKKFANNKLIFLAEQVAHVCNPSTQEAEAGDLKFEGRLG
jgi:hypothetical protein